MNWRYEKLEHGYDPDAPLAEGWFNINRSGSPYLTMSDVSGTETSGGNWGKLSTEITEPLLKLHNLLTFSPNVLYNFYKLFAFVGGRVPRKDEFGVQSYNTIEKHNNFTDAFVVVERDNNPSQEICAVGYTTDNDYLNEWLRQTIDPSIPNNWDELHREKEFEVLITTTTFSQEKVKVVGRTYEECVETMKQNDPELDVGDMGNLFSGMKTTSKKEGAKPILSSYEEWFSLNEKEVA